MPNLCEYLPILLTAGTDYSFNARIVTIPASNAPSEFCFDVDITDDTIVEPNEEFVVNLQVPLGVDGEAGSVTSTTVTIVDNDGQ